MAKIGLKSLRYCNADDCLDAVRYLTEPIELKLELQKPTIKVSNEELFGILKLPEKYVITKPNKKGKCATILFWDLDDENNKTVVKLSKGDNYDKRLGFLIAYFQKHSGLSRTQANKYLDNLTED